MIEWNNGSGTTPRRKPMSLMWLPCFWTLTQGKAPSTGPEQILPMFAIRKVQDCRSPDIIIGVIIYPGSILGIFLMDFLVRDTQRTSTPNCLSSFFTTVIYNSCSGKCSKYPNAHCITMRAIEDVVSGVKWFAAAPGIKLFRICRLLLKSVSSEYGACLHLCAVLVDANNNSVLPAGTLPW